MRYIEFGEQKAKASEVMIGLMRIKEMSVLEVTELIEAALDEGINALDIADVYGRGTCETILGEVFAANPGLRDRVFLQSKVGIRKEPDGFTWYDFSKEHIIEAVDAGLARMGVDHVDSMLLHRPDVLMEPDEVGEALETLKDQGKVLDWGVSNLNPAMLGRLERCVPVKLATNQVQLSCAFTPAFNGAFNVNMENDAAIMRDGGIFEYCEDRDMVIQAWSTMQYGYFEGVFLGSPKYPELNAKLEELAEKYDVTPMAVALAWVLRYPAKMQAVIGTTKPSRVREAARACDFELTRKEWYEIYCSAGNVLP